MTREELNALPCVAPDLPDDEHRMECAYCGATYDARLLGDVMHHLEPDHGVND